MTVQVHRYVGATVLRIRVSVGSSRSSVKACLFLSNTLALVQVGWYILLVTASLIITVLYLYNRVRITENPFFLQFYFIPSFFFQLHNYKIALQRAVICYKSKLERLLRDRILKFLIFNKRVFYRKSLTLWGWMPQYAWKFLYLFRAKTARNIAGNNFTILIDVLIQKISLHSKFLII